MAAGGAGEYSVTKILFDTGWLTLARSTSDPEFQVYMRSVSLAHLPILAATPKRNASNNLCGAVTVRSTVAMSSMLWLGACHQSMG